MLRNMARQSQTLLRLLFCCMTIPWAFMASWDVGVGRTVVERGRKLERPETVTVQEAFAGREETHKVYARKFSAPSPADNDASYASFENQSNSSYLKVILIFVCIIVAGAVIFFTGWSCFNWRGAADHESDMELNDLSAQTPELEFAQTPRSFSYSELSAATRNFSDHEKLGRGGFGSVYKGILPGTGEAVAIKRISQGSRQGRKEYESEITIMSKVRHPNLVQLLGFCHERDELLLVYELLPNRSLDKLLFGEHKGGVNWEIRYRIACDVACSLVYLHEDCDQCVVHRDLKCSNIMLDINFNAKVGDFGLSREVESNDEASHTTMVAGTPGYMAPECVVTRKARPELDVFSFGAVSLAIACGKRPVEPSLREHDSRLVQWVWDLYGKGKVLDAADERLGGNFNPKEMERLMAVGLLCSHPDPKARPTMREVVNILKFEAKLPFIPQNLPVAVYANPHGSHRMSESTSKAYETAMTLNSSNMSGVNIDIV